MCGLGLAIDLCTRELVINFCSKQLLQLTMNSRSHCKSETFFSSRLDSCILDESCPELHMFLAITQDTQFHI